MLAFRRTVVVLAVSLAVAVLAAVASVASAQPTAPTSAEVAGLVRAADFIGFVRARPATYYSPTDRSRAWDILGCVEVVKGEVPHRDGRFSNGMIFGRRTRAAIRGRSEITQNPFSGFNDDGFYLLFAAHASAGARSPGAILAAYRVEYRPNGNGHVVGCLSGYPHWNREADVAAVSQLLRDVLQGNGHSAAASARLSDWLQSAALAAQHEPFTSGERYVQAQALAAGIVPGTPRGDVEKIFLQRVGGPDSGEPNDIYDAGNAVTVEVPYDSSGRVSGPLRVYRQP